MTGSVVAQKSHPVEKVLRMDRMPHIWCPGCGIGTAVNCFAHAIIDREDLDKICIVSGIGCTARVAGYLKLDSFHATHGRAIPFATGLKLANPELQVVIFSGDGDLAAIGGNHFIHAARRNIDLTIICINNFIYGMTGGQLAPTTPLTARSTTSPYGNYEYPFNLPHLASSCGAVYVARWTVYHVRRVIKSIQEAMAKRGFSFIEILSPCPTVYGRRNRLGGGLEILKYYKENSEIKENIDLAQADIEFQGKIVLGKFVDRERPDFLESLNTGLKQALGDRYQEYGGER